jgi:methylmalonyl-CoA mutase
LNFKILLKVSVFLKNEVTLSLFLNKLLDYSPYSNKMDKPEQPQKLFSEFTPVTTAQWESLIQSDLKGADYDKKLVWKTREGIPVKPYYRKEDLEDLPAVDSLPGEYPFLRGNNTKNNEWEIRQEVPQTDPVLANALAKDMIKRGAEGLVLNTSSIHTQGDLKDLLRTIDLNLTRLHFTTADSYSFLFEAFNNLVQESSADPGLVQGSLDFDPVGDLLLKGDFHTSREDNFSEAYYLIKTAAGQLPSFRVINVNGRHFHHAGANLVQELAFTMAAGVEYLSELTDRGLNIDAISPRLQFSLAIGSDYFPQIAKIRALRSLWARIIRQYHPAKDFSMEMFIHSVTSRRNMSLYDPYVNMLRSTTEAMSAAIAGSEAISIEPFDHTYKKADDFSLRIARNQQIILKRESWLTKVIDPAGGSYYIEKLTQVLADEAWKLFLLVEEKGGLISCFEEGYIQQELEKMAQEAESDLAKRKTVLLGTNQYPNTGEAMLDKIEAGQELAGNFEQTKYKPLHLRRLSLDFDHLRLATERFKKETGKLPCVFLFTIGNPAMRKARAGFAVNFFGCSGYHIIDNPGFDHVEDGVKACRVSKPDIVVVCSSDEEYVTLVPEICSAFKANDPVPILVLAGNPKEMASVYSKEGITEFIHLQTNLIESLGNFHQKLGIKL